MRRMGEPNMQFPKFQAMHGPADDRQAVGAEIVETYRGRLPDEILTEWETTGWCSYGGGLLWLVDPSTYDGLLGDWLPEPAGCTVFMRTAFAGLIYWDGTDANFLDVFSDDVTAIFDEMSWVFDGTLCRHEFLDDVLDRDYFVSEGPRLGRLAPDECYGYVPPPALGGSRSPDSLQRVKIREHLAFLGQLRG